MSSQQQARIQQAREEQHNEWRQKKAAQAAESAQQQQQEMAMQFKNAFFEEWVASQPDCRKCYEDFEEFLRERGDELYAYYQVFGPQHVRTQLLQKRNERLQTLPGYIESVRQDDQRQYKEVAKFENQYDLYEREQEKKWKIFSRIAELETKSRYDGIALKEQEELERLREEYEILKQKTDSFEAFSAASASAGHPAFRFSIPKKAKKSGKKAKKSGKKSKKSVKKSKKSGKKAKKSLRKARK